MASTVRLGELIGETTAGGRRCPCLLLSQGRATMGPPGQHLGMLKPLPHSRKFDRTSPLHRLGVFLWNNDACGASIVSRWPDGNLRRAYCVPKRDAQPTGSERALHGVEPCLPMSIWIMSPTTSCTRKSSHFYWSTQDASRRSGRASPGKR